MIMRWWIPGCVGLMVLVSACGSEPLSQDASLAEDMATSLPEEEVAIAPTDATDASESSAAPETEVFADLGEPLPPPDPATIAELIPPTTTPQRLPQVSAGRTDPFAAIASNPIVVPSQARSSPPDAASPLPVTPIPQPAVMPAPIDVGTLPTIPVAGSGAGVMPGIDPTAIAAPAPPELEITGVVQVGDRWNVIVHVPGESTSRYVGIGAVLENGRTIVRRVEVVANQEPRVILERDGIEVIRTVGS
jgi:hypothetical protein